MKSLYTTFFFLLIGTLTAIAQSPHAAKLYGMTQYGGTIHNGSIFHFTPETQTITVDYEFQTIVKGKAPKCDIVSGNNGQYYGTTTAGGLNNAGVIFKWDSLTSEYQEIYNFSGIDGNDARGGMVLYNSKLYGMTNLGGIHNSGVIYEWDIVNNIYIKKIDMDSISGKNPIGSLTLIGNLFYGSTISGGTYNKGVLFTYDPTANVYTKVFDFDSISGSNPVGKLAPYNSKLYGMTKKGGTNNLGVIYEWNYSTNTVIKKHDFNGINGRLPMGSLTLYNNKFYGMTPSGGNDTIHGIIFEWNPTNNVFTQKKEFANNSYAPIGSLTMKDGLFYGITSLGASQGCIFTWDPSSNILKNLFYNRPSPFDPRVTCNEYKVSTGTFPYCTFFLSGDKLLGSSSSDGSENAGIIFEYYPDSNQITRSVHMLASDGKYPRGSLTRVGNKLFGFTTYGGINHDGNIIEWDMDAQQFTERYSFAGDNTSIWPQGTPTLLNGELYGMNSRGKSLYLNSASSYLNRGFSEIFSWNPTNNLYQRHYNLDNQTSLPVSFSVFNNGLIFPLQKTVTYPSAPSSYFAMAQFDPLTNILKDSIQVLGGGAFVNYQNSQSGNGLTYYNGKYYGMTPGGWNPAVGFEMKGTIYEWDTLLNYGTHRLNLVDSIGGTYPTGDLVLVDSVFYGLTSGVSSEGIYNNGGLFRWNPTTNVCKRLTYLGGFGTPTYSNGKLYWLCGSAQQSIAEYDIANDTTLFYSLPEYLSSPPNVPYSWFDFGCAENAYLKLLEVIPNEVPVLVSAPVTQQICSDQSGATTFTITDADNDTLQFDVSSSNGTIIPLQNISISNAGNVYTISFLAASQSGSSTISIVANDGYGGSVSFSFIIQVHSIPDSTITQNGISLIANESNASYQWVDCNNNNTPLTGATQQIFTPTISGNYAVIITDPLGCSVISDCILVTTVGINEQDTSTRFIIYPNPTNGELIINPINDVSRIDVFDVLGQRIFSIKPYNSNVFNVSKLSSGIYIVKIIENSGKVTNANFIKE